MIGSVWLRYYGHVSITDLIGPIQNGGSLKKDTATLQVISLNKVSNCEKNKTFPWNNSSKEEIFILCSPQDLGKVWSFSVLGLLKKDCVLPLINSVHYKRPLKCEFKLAHFSTAYKHKSTVIEQGTENLHFLKGDWISKPQFHCTCLIDTVGTWFLILSNLTLCQKHSLWQCMFRTSGYTSECLTIVLAAACKFWSHICWRTKHLVLSSEGVVMRTFPELVLRTTFTWRPFLGRLSTFSNWSRLSWLSFSEVFFSWPNIKVFHEDLVVVFQTGEKTWTDL